jgi:hypothetical protein
MEQRKKAFDKYLEDFKANVLCLEEMAEKFGYQPDSDGE